MGDYLKLKSWDLRQLEFLTKRLRLNMKNPEQVEAEANMLEGIIAEIATLNGIDLSKQVYYGSNEPNTLNTRKG